MQMPNLTKSMVGITQTQAQTLIDKAVDETRLAIDNHWSTVLKPTVSSSLYV